MSEPIDIITNYENARETFLAIIEKKYESLAKYAEKENANTWVIEQGNAEIQACYAFIEQADDAIIKLRHELNNEEVIQEYLDDTGRKNYLKWLDKKIVELKSELNNVL